MTTLVTLKQRNEKPPKTVCGAPMKGRYRTCQRNAGDGTNHSGYGLCSRHGGLLPENQRKAALTEAMYLGKTYGSSIKTDPAQALVDELARTNGAGAPHTTARRSTVSPFQPSRPGAAAPPALLEGGIFFDAFQDNFPSPIVPVFKYGQSYYAGVADNYIKEARSGLWIPTN